LARPPGISEWLTALVLCASTHRPCAKTVRIDRSKKNTPCGDRSFCQSAVVKGKGCSPA
jgi:hypothetical protein